MSPSSSRTALGSISLRSGARAPPRFSSQYAKNSRLDGCFMALSCLRGLAKWDRSVPLSRTRILGLALQGRLCSVHAADVFSSRAGGRIAAVTLNQRRGLSWWHYWCRTLNSAASRQFCPKWALREESGPPIICSVRRLCGPSIFIAFKNPVHGLLTSLELMFGIQV